MQMSSYSFQSKIKKNAYAIIHTPFKHLVLNTKKIKETTPN